MQDSARRAPQSSRKIQGAELEMKSCESETKTFWSQRLAAFVASFTLLEVGLGTGWSSPYLAKLSLQENVDGISKITNEELSWMGSLMNLGKIFGTIGGAVAQETLGRKMSLFFAGIPMLSGWTCVVAASSVVWLYASRVLCGFAAGMIWTSLSLYLAEIADPEVRGSLILWNVSSRSIGVFIGNLMGSYLSLQVFAYVCMIPNLMFLLLFPLIPDSPYRYIMKGELERAEASLKWFRRRDNVKLELQELQDYVQISNYTLMERLRELTESRYLRSFGLMILINIFGYFGAYNAISSYKEIIMKKTQTDVPASTIVMISAFCSIIAGLLSTCLVDRFGRRILMLVSALGMAVTLTLLGLHFLLLDLGFNPKLMSWLPCSMIILYSISYSLGFGCIPCTLVSELFSPKIKTLTSLGFSGTSAIFSALSTATFIPFLNLVGTSYMFWFYATGTYISLVYFYYVMPETTGKSLKDIQTEERIK